MNTVLLTYRDHNIITIHSLYFLYHLIHCVADFNDNEKIKTIMSLHVTVQSRRLALTMFYILLVIIIIIIIIIIIRMLVS